MIYINANLFKWFINFMIKKTSNTKKGTGIISRIVFENKQSAKYLHKPDIKKLKNEKYTHLL